MRARWWSGLAAVVVTALAFVLVLLDLADTGFRRWWSEHALTTSTVTGLLVLLITVLVVDQVVGRRQARDRSRAVAAQATILLTQASRAAKAVTAARGGSGDAASADAEIRDYALALLVSAPVLIDDPTARTVLERAQHLGAVLSRQRAHLDDPATPATGTAHDRADRGDRDDREYERAVAQLREACAPLLARLQPEEQAAITGAR